MTTIKPYAIECVFTEPDGQVYGSYIKKRKYKCLTDAFKALKDLRKQYTVVTWSIPGLSSEYDCLYYFNFKIIHNN